jgi:hypothetical protein
MMGRFPGFIPDCVSPGCVSSGKNQGVLVDIGNRVIGAKALLTPSPDPFKFNEIVVGVLGRSLEISPLELCNLVILANHFHGLAVVDDLRQLSRFMQHFETNLSKEVGTRLRDWPGTIWDGRYNKIVVSDEPDVQRALLKYQLSNSVKEGLLESPFQWPGVHAAGSLVTGEALKGYWFNRSAEWTARNQGKEVGHYDFATEYKVSFAPLPAFRHLSEEAYREMVAEIVREIEEEGEAQRDGDSVAGVARILLQNPYEKPTRKSKSSLKPLFHVRDRDLKKAMRAELSEHLAQRQEATERLLGAAGETGASLGFPVGCYPPFLPFVGDLLPPCPPAPPTREITDLGGGRIARGPIPVVIIPVRVERVGILRPEGRAPP